jgi:hypothetical protein
MKILTTILTCPSTQNRADACSDTWINDIKSPHEYYFYGSKIQSEKMDRTWNCEPDDGEQRDRLPEKTYKMLVESLNHDWNFLFKCDDDTYVNFDKLVEFLKDYDANDDLYIGRNPPADDQHPRFSFLYAQGGGGYILSRSAVEKCLYSLKYFYKDKSKNESAEDYSVGLALHEQQINLKHTDLLSSQPVLDAEQSACIDAINKNNKITTHYVNPDTMIEIYKTNNE